MKINYLIKILQFIYYDVHILQVLQRSVSRMFDRSALANEESKLLRDEIFLASDESLFHSLGPV